MKFLLVIAVVVGAAWYYLKPLPPGQGPEADHGKREASALISAIESYRSAHGLYPATLEDMIPDYLAGVPHLRNGSSYEYERISQRYQLTFNYTNPLPVHCTYGSGKWACAWF